MPEINLPYNWRRRPYQEPLWKYLSRGGRQAVVAWHRRAGKDEIALHHAACAAHERIANYWHCFPQYASARKGIWESVNPNTGRRRIDEAFPPVIRDSIREDEMLIKFKSGSTWQVIGSDRYKDLVGGGIAGISYSEFAKGHPAAYAYFQPMLLENNGWNLAISTPEGKNHFYAMYKEAKRNPKAFAELLTIEDTIRICEQHGIEPSVSLEDVEDSRFDYRSLYGEEVGDSLIQQEWWCDWSAAVLGAFWGKELAKAEREGRICDLPILPDYPISTAWDIGVDDPMAIWIFQRGPGWFHIVDYIEGSNQGFDYYCDWLKERGYTPKKNHRGELVGDDWVPHDAKQREPGAPKGRTRIQTLFALGRNPKLVPDHKPMDRVNAGRRLLPHVKFDERRCAKGLEILRAYKAEWNPKARTFAKSIKHDYASHGGDGFGHMAVAVDAPRELPKIVKPGAKGHQLTVNELLRTQRPNREWA